MNDNTTEVGVQRTVFPADNDELELAAWVQPPICGNCEGRVDTFYRYNGPDDARCADCGEEWVIE